MPILGSRNQTFIAQDTRPPLLVTPSNFILLVRVRPRVAPPKLIGPPSVSLPVPMASPNATSPPKVLALSTVRAVTPEVAKVPPLRVSVPVPNGPAVGAPAEPVLSTPTRKIVPAATVIPPLNVLLVLVSETAPVLGCVSEINRLIKITFK